MNEFFICAIITFGITLFTGMVANDLDRRYQKLNKDTPAWGIIFTFTAYAALVATLVLLVLGVIEAID